VSVGSFLASAPFTMYSGFSFSKGAGGEWSLAGGDNWARSAHFNTKGANLIKSLYSCW